MKHVEAVYEKEVRPLMEKVLEICKRENILMAATLCIQGDKDDVYSWWNLAPEHPAEVITDVQGDASLPGAGKVIEKMEPMKVQTDCGEFEIISSGSERFLKMDVTPSVPFYMGGVAVGMVMRNVIIIRPPEYRKLKKLLEEGKVLGLSLAGTADNGIKGECDA